MTPEQINQRWDAINEQMAQLMREQDQLKKQKAQNDFLQLLIDRKENPVVKVEIDGRKFRGYGRVQIVNDEPLILVQGVMEVSF